MENTTKTYKVLRIKHKVKNTANSKTFLYYVDKHTPLTKNIEVAKNFEETDVKELIIGFQYCINNFLLESLEYVAVTINTVVEPIDMDQPYIIEERRRLAISKLNDDDIKALGVERLATYNKLKYHNVEEDNETDDEDSDF